MPSERFDRLPEEKRRKIQAAAFREFSEQPFQTASINSIIREAGISRGSFYTYFEDKLDLLQWILWQNAEEFRTRVLRHLKQKGGDLFACAMFLYEFCREQFQGSGSLSFLKNIVSDFEAFRTVCPDTFGVEESGLQKRIGSLLTEISEALDNRRYSLTEQQIAGCFPLILMLTIRAAARATEHPDREQEIRQMLKLQLDLMKYGALRRRPGDLKEIEQPAEEEGVIV